MRRSSRRLCCRQAANGGLSVAEGGATFSSVDESLLVSRLTRAALIAGLIAGGLSLLLAFVLAYRLLRPVEALTQAASSWARATWRSASR